YHLACSEAETEMQTTLGHQLKQLLKEPLQSEQMLYENLVQFYEEFERDLELQEAMGEQNTNFVRLFMYRRFLEIYKQLPEKMRGDQLKGFFSLITQQPNNGDFSLIFEAGIRQLIKQISKEEAKTIY